VSTAHRIPLTFWSGGTNEVVLFMAAASVDLPAVVAPGIIIVDGGLHPDGPPDVSGDHL
jgi:hypothetical protein